MASGPTMTDCPQDIHELARCGSLTQFVEAVVTDEQALTRVDYSGNTAFLLAVSYSNWVVLRWLHAHTSLDPKEADAWGYTAVLWAASSGHLDVLRWLLSLQKGFTLADRAGNGHSALHLAILWGRWETAQWILTQDSTTLTARSDNHASVWSMLVRFARHAHPTSTEHADLYSLLRGYSYASPVDFERTNVISHLSAPHQRDLSQIDSIYMKPSFLWYRAKQVDILAWGKGNEPERSSSDCVSVVFIPDLQKIIVEYLGHVELAKHLPASSFRRSVVLEDNERACM